MKPGLLGGSVNRPSKRGHADSSSFLEVIEAANLSGLGPFGG